MKKQHAIEKGIEILRSAQIKPSAKVNLHLKSLGTSEIRRDTTLENLLKRPEVAIKDLISLDSSNIEIPEIAYNQIEIEVKYEGFIKRQLKDVERFENLEKIKVPLDMDYSRISSLSREIREKLTKFRPLNLGQASRISGVTPAAVSLLMVYLRKLNG